jgi:hypothetical protein
MAKPERYQMGFVGQENPEGTGRFVRKLREKVVIRSPHDVAQHLLKDSWFSLKEKGLGFD